MSPIAVLLSFPIFVASGFEGKLRRTDSPLDQSEPWLKRIPSPTDWSKKPGRNAER